MDPIITKMLEGVPYNGMGSALERNALIGVIRNLINEDKFTVDYILNYAESVGYSRQMAEDVFKELTGLSPKLIVNNNDYYKMPSYVPNMCIAWGISKSAKDKAYYIVPFEYGYSVMEKDEVNAPIPTVISATIPEAFDELKKVAKNIQTLDKIITKKLLETENVQSTANDVHQVNLPYSASPLQVLKKNFKDKILSVAEFEKQASKLLQAEEITVDEAEDLMNWKQELVDEDESYANEVLQLDENWKPLGAEDINENDPDYENRVKEAYNQLVGMLDEFDIFKEFAETTGADRLFDAYIRLGRDIADEWDIKPESLFGEIAIENPKLVQKIEQADIDNFNETIKNWNRSQKEFPWKGGSKKASKKVTAENMTLDDIEAEDNKDQVQEEIEKINETPVEDIFAETTPEQYLDKALQEDKVDTINDVVSKCIDKFSEKFKDFDKYQVKILSYNTKVLGDYEPTEDELVEDKELNANAILQVIMSITNKADETTMKKVLAVFSITNGELHWTGTVRGENDQVVAFTEEGLDALFEVEEPSEEELEDII